jgi:hypothetical protein
LHTPADAAGAQQLSQCAFPGAYCGFKCGVDGTDARVVALDREILALARAGLRFIRQW